MTQSIISKFVGQQPVTLSKINTTTNFFRKIFLSFWIYTGTPVNICFRRFFRSWYFHSIYFLFFLSKETNVLKLLVGSVAKKPQSFAKIVNCLIIFVKLSILDVCRGSGYASKYFFMYYEKKSWRSSPHEEEFFAVVIISCGNLDYYATNNRGSEQHFCWIN